MNCFVDCFDLPFDVVERCIARELFEHHVPRVFSENHKSVGVLEFLTYGQIFGFSRFSTFWIVRSTLPFEQKYEWRFDTHEDFECFVVRTCAFYNGLFSSQPRLAHQQLRSLQVVLY